MANLQRFSSAMILLSIGLLLLSGCQLMTKQDNSSTSYGEYYLILQQLNQQQLTDEVSKQQRTLEKTTKTNSQMHYDAQIKLLLLYSLPTSPIYNAFNAKVLLNELNSEENNAALANINPSEQAFISLLRDQLNQCLLMRSRLLAQQQELVQAQRQQAIKQQQTLIEQVKLLEQTIKQLKNIEQAIDKRDQ
ncbi:hypothetical protein H4J58_16000 [Colwellia sp. MB3u-70]|uniref:hypothetical protein n=1 Tax=unclassified Colwellia TaxID=196834 RepID=UPI0015F5DFBC|nr:MULTISPECIES: hypothetical protein [unclassified Colwellia]MBA6291971.1 hypothetical protein [Colwellia sp. MB3u-8]MBA6308615.1 hypothetical protein [Colwellia sp. MB3u-70]